MALFEKGQSGNPAGKPKGTLAKRSREIAERASREGLTPLEVILKCMNEALAEGKRDDAARYAAMAAPYVHPRLQTMEHSTKDDKPVKLEVSWCHGDNDAPEWARDVTREPPAPKVY